MFPKYLTFHRKGIDHHFKIRRYTNYSDPINDKRKKEAQLFNDLLKKDYEEYIQRVRNSDLDTKAKEIKYVLENCGEHWSICADFLQRVVWETNIRDLEHLGLYVIPQSKGEQDHSKDEAKRSTPHFNIKPFKRMPNVREFKVKVRSYDWLLALFGLKKRIEPEYEWTKYNNKKINRYIDHQIKRLDNCRRTGDDRKYWRISMFLIKRSTSFFLIQLKKTFPRWHREEKLWWVIRLYKRYLELARYGNTDLRYKRVFIEKSANKKRPLGVPSAEWRIYLGLIHLFTQHFLWYKISRNQHAYTHSKGTLTAWGQTILTVIKSKNIFEFDLKGFFDSVDIIDLKEICEKYGIPRNISTMIFNINTKLPDGLIPHDKNGNLLFYQDRTRNDLGDEGWELVENVTDSQLEQVITSEPIKIDPRWIWSFPYKPLESDKWINIKVRGVPQGSPISPLLSLLALEETLFREFPGQVIMYADDGVLYGDELDDKQIQDKLSNLNHGISINWSKSGWVKKNNEWVKPLKFLGLKYDGKILESETRSGRNLELSERILKLASIIRTRDLELKLGYRKLHDDNSKLDNLVKSSIWGLVQNRLYNGSYETGEIVQNFRLEGYKKGSWLSYREFMLHNDKLTVFNSTSYALRSLYYKLKKVKFVPKTGRYEEWAWARPVNARLVNNMEIDPKDEHIHSNNLIYKKKMNEAVEISINAKKTEEEIWVNPNRRERVRTVEENKRRIRVPENSWLYGEAYFCFLKWYRNLTQTEKTQENKSTDVANINKQTHIKSSKVIKQSFWIKFGTKGWWKWRNKKLGYENRRPCFFFNKRSYYPPIRYAIWWDIKQIWKDILSIPMTKKEGEWLWFEPDFQGLWRTTHLIGIMISILLLYDPWSNTNANQELGNQEMIESIEENNFLPWFIIGAIVLFTLAAMHSSMSFEASQNSLLEGIVRDQASIIEGQRLTIEILRKEGG